MKEWFKTVLKRFGDLIIKLIAVKTVVAIMVSVLYMAQKEKTTADFIVVAVVWLGVAGIRYMEKVAGVLKKPE